jgi:N-acetylmuramoyl-L-alanine amidase
MSLFLGSRFAMFLLKIVMLAVAINALGLTEAQARRNGPARTEPIDMVVIHSTGGPTCDVKTGKPIWVKAGALEENMRNIEAHPSLGIHYMIDRDGILRKSIPEGQVAHHVFRYSGRSISIELINDGDGVDVFPEVQLSALVTLLSDIKQRLNIARSGVKRHSDLDNAVMSCDRTKRRKVDPGAAFPYETVLGRVYK